MALRRMAILPRARAAASDAFLGGRVGVLDVAGRYDCRVWSEEAGVAVTRYTVAWSTETQPSVPVQYGLIHGTEKRVLSL